jgi:hypothetical protein
MEAGGRATARFWMFPTKAGVTPGVVELWGSPGDPEGRTSIVT